MQNEEMAKWIEGTLGPDVPLHFSRFHPQYMLKNLPKTPIRSLNAAREISLNAGMKFVYVGNVLDKKAASTYCPKCDKVLVGRIAYTVTENNVKKGACGFCGESIPGVWSP